MESDKNPRKKILGFAMHIDLRGVGRLFCAQILQGLPAFRQIVNGVGRGIVILELWTYYIGKDDEYACILIDDVVFFTPHKPLERTIAHFENKKRQPTTVANSYYITYDKLLFIKS